MSTDPEETCTNLSTEELVTSKPRRLVKAFVKLKPEKFCKLGDYIEKEAEEGSDNEEHDHIAKPILDNEEPENKDPNEEEIEDIINKYLDENSRRDYKKILAKFNEEGLAKDRIEIKEVINCQVERKKRKHKALEKMDSFQEMSVYSLSQRIRRSQHSKLGEDNQDIRTKFTTISKMRRQLLSQGENEQNETEEEKNSVQKDDEGTEEISQMIDNYEKEVKQHIVQQSSEMKKYLKERMDDNEQILKSVINLNGPVKQRAKSIGVAGARLGPFSQNSVLNALKNDKYGSFKHNAENQEKTRQSVNLFNPKVSFDKYDSENRQKIQNIFTNPQYAETSYQPLKLNKNKK